MASTYLQRTPASAGNRKTWTFSAWVKRANLVDGRLTSCYSASNDNDNIDILFSSDSITIVGWTTTWRTTNRKFRDTSAWYHIVIEVDTTQATANDRIKIYINGVQETSFSTTNNPSQNADIGYNQASTTRIASASNSVGGHLDGQMTHIHFVDGTAYDADTFGETDATTGIWKPKTAPSVTYGTNGFFLKFENSGAFGTDSSGNGNNFTVNGTMTQTIDTPSNVFATGNPLAYTSTLTNGNLKMAGTSSYDTLVSSLAVSSGKYYAEMKCDTTSTATLLGILDEAQWSTRATGYHIVGDQSNSFAYANNGRLVNAGDTPNWGATYTTGDIIGIALDCDNSKLYFSKNGTWQNSANPSAGTGGVTIPSGKDYYIAFTNRTSDVTSINFGNGYFGTTAVSSAQNPDDGIGIFEYSPPTGYKALCTKSINSQEYD